MSYYEEVRAKLVAMAQAELDEDKKLILTDAAQLLNSADCLFSATTHAAKNMGFTGEGFQDAFYFLQDKGAEILQAARQSKAGPLVDDVEEKANALLDSITKYKQGVQP